MLKSEVKKMSVKLIKTKICHPNSCGSIECKDCIFYDPNNQRERGAYCYALSTDYDWGAITNHDFGDKTEASIDDLKQFKR